MAELTIVTMHFAWPNLDQAEQCCITNYVAGVVPIMFPGFVVGGSCFVDSVGKYFTNLSLTSRSAGLPVGPPAGRSFPRIEMASAI